MNKQILAVLVVLAIGGAVAGYYGFRGDEGAENARSAATSAVAFDPSPDAQKHVVTYTYRLMPADIQADRETPAITVDAKGRTLVAYASQTDSLERTLYLATSKDGNRFETPKAFRKVPIYKYAAGSSRKKADPAKAEAKAEPEKPAMTYSTHVLPRLVSHGDEITLGWVEAVNGGPKVVYYAAKSTDGGQTFSEPTPVHSPNVSKPGFTSLSAASTGELEAAWLDGGKPVVAVKRTGSDGFDAETVAYPGPPAGGGVCPCCDTAVIHPENGPLLVAFRNNDGDRRDIWIAKADDKGFKPAAPVGKHLWNFKGCPHDGPSLTSVGGKIQAVFMDAHTGVNRIYFAESDVASLAFDPRELAADSKGSQGHPRIVPSGNGLVAIWDESLDAAVAKPAADQAPTHGAGHNPAAALSGSGRAVRLAVSTDEKTFGPSMPVHPSEGAFQLNPAAAVLPNGDVLVTWNELDNDGKSIVVTRVQAQKLRK